MTGQRREGHRRTENVRELFHPWTAYTLMQTKPLSWRLYFNFLKVIKDLLRPGRGWTMVLFLIILQNSVLRARNWRGKLLVSVCFQNVSFLPGARKLWTASEARLCLTTRPCTDRVPLIVNQQALTGDTWLSLSERSHQAGSGTSVVCPGVTQQQAPVSPVGMTRTPDHEFLPQVPPCLLPPLIVIAT